MSDLFAVKLPTAIIAAMGRRTARRFEGFLDKVATLARTAAPGRHPGETGIRTEALTRWLHVLCTPSLTVLRAAAGRRRFDEKLEGVVVHDDLPTCFTLEGVRHGACGAHRLRELRALVETEKEDWAGSLQRLLLRACRVARENDRDVPASLAALTSRTRDRTIDRAIALHEAQPPPESAAAKSAEPATISRAGSGTTRRDPCVSSPTCTFRSPTTGPSAVSEWASCARRSREASARRRGPTTSPACAPSSPPPESGAGTSPEPWRVPSRCNRSRNRASETRRRRPASPEPSPPDDRRNRTWAFAQLHALKSPRRIRSEGRSRSASSSASPTAFPRAGIPRSGKGSTRVRPSLR